MALGFALLGINLNLEGYKMYKLTYKDLVTNQVYSQWLETQDACINLEVALSTYPHVTDVKWSYDEEYNK